MAKRLTSAEGKDTPKIATGSSVGRLNVVHTERTMNAYNITEPELESINLMNGIATGAFSLAAAVFGFWIDFRKDMIFAEKLSTEVKVLETMTTWVGLPVILLCLGVAGWALWRKGTIVRRIKRDSRVIAG